jgi:hypothetical protein
MLCNKICYIFREVVETSEHPRTFFAKCCFMFKIKPDAAVLLYFSKIIGKICCNLKSSLIRRKNLNELIGVQR